jgi:hypothetical protein
VSGPRDLGSLLEPVEDQAQDQSCTRIAKQLKQLLHLWCMGLGVLLHLPEPNQQRFALLRLPSIGTWRSLRNSAVHLLLHWSRVVPSLDISSLLVAVGC